MAADEGLTDDPWAEARRAMVKSQLRRRGIDDSAVLSAMEAVPRHLFVPDELRDAAYQDRPLPIGRGQTISQPYIVARMANLAAIDPDDEILEVGAGCGYAAAVLARLGRSVVTVEILPELARTARANLATVGVENVEVVTGGIDSVDATRDFGAVLVAAAAREIPPKLEEKLEDGAVLVIPVGTRHGQRMWTVRRERDQLHREAHEPVAFVPLVD